MMTRIFTIVGVSAVLILIALWLIGGGYERIKASIHSTLNPFSLIFPGATASDQEGTTFRLPWQPDIYNLGATGSSTSGLPSATGPDIRYEGTIYGQVPEGSVDGAQLGQYENAVDARTRLDSIGTPSPYARAIAFAGSSLNTADATTEFLALQSAQDSGTISLAGWSVESMATHKKYPLPQAASLLVTGQVNNVADIVSTGPSTIIISSGKSPLGASFEENACTLYLAQFQTFAPPLSNACASERDIDANIVGSECAAYLSSIPRCTFVDRYPASVSQQCANFTQTRLTYNGCVAAHKNDRDFNLNVWRVYLGSDTKLWAPDDLLRLLDAQGRVVDILRT